MTSDRLMSIVYRPTVRTETLLLADLNEFINSVTEGLLSVLFLVSK